MRTRIDHPGIRTLRRTLARCLAIVCALGAVACGGADPSPDATTPRLENEWDDMSWDTGEWACRPMVSRSDIT